MLENHKTMALAAFLLLGSHASAQAPVVDTLEAGGRSVRFATFNVSLNRASSGALIRDLSTPDDKQARAVAEILQRVDADVVLLNEFDYDKEGKAIDLFRSKYLEVAQNGAKPLRYPHVFLAPSNTGIDSGLDLDNDKQVGGPGDAFGFGFFPGQFGMVLLSKHRIDGARSRTFQNFLWKDMPGARLPDDAATSAPRDWFTKQELDVVRLSSKSHWDVVVHVEGLRVHCLCAHPTPPVFDGPEDRNGTRNHDELRFWSDYVLPWSSRYIRDDKGRRGGLDFGDRFVILGDYNADPFDGDSTAKAASWLTLNPFINTKRTPSSDGGPEAARLQGQANANHVGAPRFDTADFSDATPGNLRVDYALPSWNMRLKSAAVFWPVQADPLARLTGDGTTIVSSDHRMTWVDVDPRRFERLGDFDGAWLRWAAWLKWVARN